MISEKKSAGRRAAEYAEDGMVLGLGTGSTVLYTLERLSERIKEDGLDVIGVPTSSATEKIAKDLKISLTSLDEHHEIDLTIDGADEIDREYNLIKGGGGALLREKMVAHNSDKMIVIADQSKMVDTLGISFKLPVEILPLWINVTIKNVEALGCKAELRVKDGTVFETDNGNYIIDCKFDGIEEPMVLSGRLNAVPGVVENGLFVGLATKVIVGKKDGFEELSID